MKVLSGHDAISKPGLQGDGLHAGPGPLPSHPGLAVAAPMGLASQGCVPSSLGGGGCLFIVLTAHSSRARDPAEPARCWQAVEGLSGTWRARVSEKAASAQNSYLLPPGMRKGLSYKGR